MKKPSRFLRVFGIAGLLISLLAATVAPVGAQDEGEEEAPLDDFIASLLDLNDGMFRDGENAIFYPWVANGEDFGLGASQTSISVQNLEDQDGSIAIYVGDGAGGFELATSAFLSAYASKTFHADDLGIEEGSGAPVAVIGFAEFSGEGEADEVFVDLEPGEPLVETAVELSKPEGVEGDFTQVDACVINDGAGNPVGFAVAAEFTFDGVTYTPGTAEDPTYFVGEFTSGDLQAILDDAQAGSVEGELVNPFGGLNNDGDCSDEGIAGTEGGDLIVGITIGGVAKQAATGDSLPATSGADTAVSGYNAINGLELAQFDQFYLPIVQTNCGPGGCWDSVIRVANLAGENNAVTIRFFPADDGSGSLQTGFQIQDNVDGGATWNVNLSDLVPEGWVGSAHILSDGGVFAMVDRYKVGYNMWITNTGSSADFENVAQVENAQGNYVLFAPHVLLDYFGWNTGINVANLADADNNVSIQYFNLLGNATQVLNQRLAAHGMTYFYDPSVGAQDNNNQDVAADPNANTVGSALIWSDEPVAAAVDATKYPETDPNGGEDVFQATSYSATQNVFTWQAVPLVQKGNPTDGMGDTSGINIMNPNSVAVTANVYYVNPSGFNAQNFGTSSVTIPAFANGFVYTMTQHNLPNGFTGAAQVVASAPVAAVSANVNYQVDGDGSAIYNAFNPCGLFRVAGECTFGDVFAPGGQSVTKTFVEADGDEDPSNDVGIAGVGFSISSVEGTTDFPFQRDGFSGTEGALTFDNVPVGEYELFVTSVPEGFVAPDPLVAQDTFTVNEGEDVVLVNTLTGEGSLVKFVCAEGNTSEDSCLPDRNEIQEIATIDPFPLISCQITVSFVDSTVENTAFNLPCNISADDFEAALVAQIGAIDDGDIEVTGGPLVDLDGGPTAPFSVEFMGQYALQDAPQLMTSVVGGSTAADAAVTTVQTGGLSTVMPDATVQVFVALEDSDLLNSATWGDEVTDGPQATDADGRFEIGPLAAGTYIVCADAETAVTESCEFVEVTDEGETVVVNNLDLAGAITVSETTSQNEIQTLVTNSFTNDPFTLTYEGQTTGNIGARESGIVVQGALEALANVGAGNVTCTGSLNFGGTVECEFVGALAGEDFDEMTGTFNAGGGITVATVQDGGTAATISADAMVSGGTFTLTFDGATTAALDWDATAAEIETALNALSTIGGAGGSVGASGGPLPDADVVVVFGGTLAGTTSDLTVDNTNLN